MFSIKRLTAIITILFIYIFSTMIFAQKTIEVGEISAAPGERSDGFIVVPEGKDGGKVKIPVTVINGGTDGPILALTAGIHGYEYPPILAFQRMIKEIDPSKISGAVIFVHVANVPSFLKRTIYYNPYDWKNLNRVFPGKKGGTMTERIAYQITKEVIDKCDYLIDCHCGDGNEDLMPYLYCTEIGKPELDKKTRELAVNYGLRLIVHQTEYPKDLKNSKYVGNTAILKGKPAITIESGKLGRSDETDILRVIRGTYNIMKHLDMMKGEPELISEPVWVKNYTIIRSEHEGIFYPLVGRADHVQKGELVGYLTDFFGNTIQKVYAPHTGIVLYIIGTPPMSPGEPMISVGEF